MTLATFLLAGLLSGTPADLNGIELRDQHGGKDTLAAHQGEVVVVMVVTARRLRNLKGWERDLRERYEELRFMRVVDVPADPPVSYEDVAGKLAKRVPEGIEVLIDMERSWARALDLDTARPNLLLFNRDGDLVARTRGRAKKELVEQFAGRIEALLEAP